MATLQQIYEAYQANDPNVSQMIYDPFGWNAPYVPAATTATDTTDTTTTLPATGGVMNAYYPPVVSGDSSGSITPLDPVNLGYAGLGDQTREFLIRAQEQNMNPNLRIQDDEEGGFLNWLKQQTGKLTPGQKKTGIIGASAFLPFPLNIAGMASQFLPKGEGYAVGGLDAYQKGLYDTLASKGYIHKDPGSGLVKDIRGKNLHSFADDYEEGLQTEYNKYMERYGGRKEYEKLLKEGKIKSKYIKDTVDIWDDTLGTGAYVDQFNALKYAKTRVPEFVTGIKDGDKGAAPIDTKVAEDAIAAARYRDQAAKSPGYPGQVAPSATVAQATSTPSYSHPSAGVGAQASVDTSGSFSGKGTGNPWGRAKGGLIRKKYGNGGIADLL